jgi:hypothetical protein
MRWGPTLAGLFLSVVVPMTVAVIVMAGILWWRLP